MLEPLRQIIDEKFTIADVAARCGVSDRQARNVCRRLLGRRTRYRLTEGEFNRVHDWHRNFGNKIGRSKKKVPL